MSTKTNTVIDIHNVVSPEEINKIINDSLDKIEKDPSMSEKLPPILIRGVPGCGKSSIVREICNKRGIEFIDIRLSQLEPCDIMGLPVPNKEKKSMEWYVNGRWPRNKDGKGIIFLDELTAADKSIQVAAYQLILDRCLGDLYQVPPGYLIVAAGNQTTDRAVATTMSSALANRFLHFTLKPDSEQWCNWGLSHNIHPSVMGFIRYKPGLLFSMEGQNLEMGWPTPRSWERVSTMTHIYNNDENILRKIVYGLVGNGAGVEFMEFFKLNKEFDNILDYMLSSDKVIKIPEKSDRRYALVSAMIYHLWRGEDEDSTNRRLQGFFRICMELDSAFATMAMMSAMQGNDKITSDKACETLFRNPMYKGWADKHGSALRRRTKIDIS